MPRVLHFSAFHLEGNTGEAEVGENSSSSVEAPNEDNCRGKGSGLDGYFKQKECEVEGAKHIYICNLVVQSRTLCVVSCIEQHIRTHTRTTSYVSIRYTLHSLYARTLTEYAPLTL